MFTKHTVIKSDKGWGIKRFADLSNSWKDSHPLLSIRVNGPLDKHTKREVHLILSQDIISQVKYISDSK